MPFDASRFGNRLGYCADHNDYLNVNRNADIDEDMEGIQQWLDSGPDYNSAAVESLKRAASLGSGLSSRPPARRPRVDSRMTAPPVCLIASMGSVSERKKAMMKPVTVPEHLVPSNKIDCAGAGRYEPKSVDKRPEGFQSLPKPDLHESDDEVEVAEKTKVEPVTENSKIEAVAEFCLPAPTECKVPTPVESKRPQGVVAKLREFFEGKR